MEFNDLFDLWRGLASDVRSDEINVLGTFYVKNIETINNFILLLARDINNSCHLLIKVPVDFEIEEDDGTKGISIEEIELKNESDETNKYINISCIHYGYERDFLHYISELIHNFKKEPQRDINVVALRILEEFEFIFAKKRATTLSIKELIGLYGELYIFLKVLEQNQYLLDSWKGWEGFQWDFLNNLIAFEIKTSRRTKIPKCEISRLDQLKEPEGGELYLIYIPLLRNIETGLSFKDIIKQIESIIPNPFRFKEILRDFGFDPDNETSFKDIESYMINEEELRIYKVDENFPRIIDSSFVNLPEPIFNVKYSIDLNNIFVNYTSINDFMEILERFTQNLEE